jgi:hypothetical protein
VFERVRFLRYAWRFERAYKTDDWSKVRDCFAPDATYTVIGGAEFSGTTRGHAAIVAFFKRMLDELDRKFDKRLPGLRGMLRVKGGVLHVPWKARYVLGEQSALLTGDSTVRFSDGKITELVDTIPDGETDAVQALLRRTGKSATPS